MFCIPLVCGCPTKVTQESSEAHICPRCHNAQVAKAKERTWFEFFWIPLIPFKSKHVWMCGICRWQSPVDGQYQPPPAGGGGGYGGGGAYPPKPN